MQQQDSSGEKNSGAINDGHAPETKKRTTDANGQQGNADHGQLRERTLSLVLSTVLTSCDTDDKHQGGVGAQIQGRSKQEGRTP
jgi:hypothetical protein